VRGPAQLEKDLERTCSDFLAWDGWRTLKTDPVSRREWGKGFGEKGMADRLYIRYWPTQTCGGLAQVLWIEWKRMWPGRKVATKAQANQLDWILAERARGALVLLAGVDFEATFEAFKAWYAASGLQRRR